METSLKTGFAQIFSCCPKKSEFPKFWGGLQPPSPPCAHANYFKFSFFSRYITEWNSIPSNIMHTPSLGSSNTGNIFASWKALLPVLPPSLSTCHATNFDVASCGNMLRKVDLSSTFCNKLSILLFASQLATLHNTCDWSIFPHQKRGKDGE